MAQRCRNASTRSPIRTYETWFAALPATLRGQVAEMWGPPPGNVMTHTDGAGRRFVLIPRLQFGNVVIAAQPDWGYLQSNKALRSVNALPPHHQYLAFFLWMQHEWKAHAWVSPFTNIVLQRGKNEGPAWDDAIALMLGPTPHIHPERLGSNGGIANKRKGLAQVPGWYNLSTPADNAETYFELRARLLRYHGQPDPKVRVEYEPLIRAEVARTGLDRALDLATVAFPEYATRVTDYLDELDRTNTPSGTKVLGEGPEAEVLVGMVYAMLGSEFREALTALGRDARTTGSVLINAVLIEGRPVDDAIATVLQTPSPVVRGHLARALDYAGRLAEAPRELTSILAALDGRWLEPGPMDDPIRKPASVPPGRTLYNFDQAAIPTAEAEVIGAKQAEALIAEHRAKHGERGRPRTDRASPGRERRPARGGL